MEGLMIGGSVRLTLEISSKSPLNLSRLCFSIKASFDRVSTSFIVFCFFSFCHLYWTPTHKTHNVGVNRKALKTFFFDCFVFFSGSMISRLRLIVDDCLIVWSLLYLIEE
jgi:hypothetical protein